MAAFLPEKSPEIVQARHDGRVILFIRSRPDFQHNDADLAMRARRWHAPLIYNTMDYKGKVTGSESPRFIDSPYARLVALACFALSAAALAYVHRDDLFPKAPEPVALKDDPFARCFRDATASIDRMLAEKSIGAEQAKLFRMRAEARCRAQTGNAGGPPGAPPDLPPVR